MLKRQLGITRLVNLNDERHPAFGIAEWKRLARVLMRDTIHVLEVAIGTMFDDATSELSFLIRIVQVDHRQSNMVVAKRVARL